MTKSELTAKSRLKCSEIMTKNVRTATRDTSLQDVALIMRDGDLGSVPIVEDGRLVGMITDRDIVVRTIADGGDAQTPASEAMTAEVFSVAPDDFVFEAIRLMGEKQIRRIPVQTDEGVLAGIIAMADVALETEDQREIAETLEEISSGSGFWGRS